MKWPSTNPKLLKADYLSTREVRGNSSSCEWIPLVCYYVQVARVSEGQLELQETSPSPQRLMTCSRTATYRFCEVE